MNENMKAGFELKKLQDTVEVLENCIARLVLVETGINQTDTAEALKQGLINNIADVQASLYLMAHSTEEEIEGKFSEMEETVN